MSREWDGRTQLAVISWQSQSGRSGGNATAFRCSRAYDESHWTTETFGEIADHKVTNVRPLVVIDPEDREQVERLLDAYDGKRGGWDAGQYVDRLQAALREFANPTPSKPPEPQGRYAVVEGREGNVWVRTDEYPNLSWRLVGGPDRCASWLGLDAYLPLRVLSEGVTP